MSQQVIPFIDLKCQYSALREAINGRIQNVLDHGQYIMGPEIGELEGRLAEYVGVRHCVGASSGTDTLMMALMALGVGPGDEVITTPFSFIATAEVIVLIGARPVFVDIEPRTYNIDAALIERAITPSTKAIMPVSLYGQCADMDAINDVARRHNLPVVEDAAQSFGATYKGRRSGGLSTVGSTSFFPSKPLGCYGDAGALFTNDDLLAKSLREIRIHGQDRRYHHPRVGVNGRMDTIQAAILLAKLDRFDWEVSQRQMLGERYTSLLAECGAGAERLPLIVPGRTSVFAQYTIRVDDRARVVASLQAAGIPTAVHYPTPLHLQPAFASLRHSEGDFPVAELASKQVLSLPMGPDLSFEHQDQIAQVVCASLSVR